MPLGSQLATWSIMPPSLFVPNYTALLIANPLGLANAWHKALRLRNIENEDAFSERRVMPEIGCPRAQGGKS